eukprot:gnl/TRDRNA2_/TRDRNA2_177545_c0_seq8.p1 gnl/TRDRNA2_/TRDRNA2_177545_c0~~gnl/TRDRNA2_/TRDRNA2_177545_c0_seq8.p1  ORF type:complete len:114 (-),score=31.16 gnl/TRDRNA2_/TRDRNA2_177545_c0_seq8:405-746(-)
MCTEEELQHELEEIDFSPDRMTICKEVEGVFLLEYSDETQATALVVALHGTHEDILKHGGSSPLKISRWLADAGGGDGCQAKVSTQISMDDVTPEIRDAISKVLSGEQQDAQS